MDMPLQYIVTSVQDCTLLLLSMHTSADSWSRMRIKRPKLQRHRLLESSQHSVYT